MFPEIYLLAEEQNRSKAKELLRKSDLELRSYWEKNIAVGYWHGLYLSEATERSKNWCFKRWKKEITKIAQEN